MSWSLKLQNGDLSLEGGSYQTVQGGNKLIQDLSYWTLTPMGTDPMHPGYGSVIDGGRLPSGEIVPSPIGQTDQEAVSQQIETEITRIINQYKGQQLARIKADNLVYGRSTLSSDEVISTINGINISLFLDGIYVQVKVTTYYGQTLTLNVSSNGS